MSIISIYIKNIASFESVKMTFGDWWYEKVSVLIAKNGVGKTMALKAIYAKLKGVKPGEHDLIPEKLDIKFTEDHKPGLVWMMEENASEKKLDFELQNLFKVDQKVREKALEIAGKLNEWKEKEYKGIRFFGDVKELSYGEKKILVIATWIARAMDGDVIILDLPENGLHIEAQEQIIRLISDSEKKINAIIATHSPHVLCNEEERLAETEYNC